MASEKLYELAFAYKREKLWKKLYDSEIFAVRLPDGETGYCSVEGYLGEHNALTLYVGDRGYQSYRETAQADGGFGSYQDLLMAQDCLQCSFENKDNLSPEEQEEVRLFARSRRMTLRGANSFPRFLRYEPNRFPWHFRDGVDEARMEEALAAAAALSKLIAKRGKAALGFPEDAAEPSEIPCLVRERAGFTVKTAPVPPEMEENLPTPRPLDPQIIGRLRDLRKAGIMECEIMRVPEPMPDENGGAPWFPALLLCVDTRKRSLLPVDPVARYEEEPERLLRTFVTALIQSERCPRAVKVRDRRCWALLEDCCMRTGILMSLDDELPALDRAKEEFLNYISQYSEPEEVDDGPFGEAPEDESDLFETLMGMTDMELRSMPKPLMKQLMDLARVGFLPRELEERLRRLFR